MDLSTYLNEGKQLVDRALAESFPERVHLPGHLVQALRYTLEGKGKRFRAVLVFAVADTLGVARRVVLPVACAVELVHSCSLILDDLPCMDDADLRRGRPAHHRVYGEAVSILAAVGLLNQAFRLLADETSGRAARTHLGRPLIDLLARAVGPDGMISGQYADLDPDRAGEGLEALEYIHSRKTGSLFIASAEMSAVACGAGDRERGALRSYAKNLGLAFQITDDLLDHLGSRRALGKPVHQDSGKLTFVGLCGVEGARRLVDELIEVSRNALAPFGHRGERLVQMAEFVRTRDR